MIDIREHGGGYGGRKLAKDKVYDDSYITVDGSQGSGKFVIEAGSGNPPRSASANSTKYYIAVSTACIGYSLASGTSNYLANNSSGNEVRAVVSTNNIVAITIDNSSYPGGLWAYSPSANNSQIFSFTSNIDNKFHNAAKALEVDRKNDDLLYTSSWAGDSAFNIFRISKTGTLLWSAKAGTSYYGGSIAPYGVSGAVVVKTDGYIMRIGDSGQIINTVSMSNISSLAVATEGDYIYVSRFNTTLGRCTIIELNPDLSIRREVPFGYLNQNYTTNSLKISSGYIFVFNRGEMYKIDLGSLQVVLLITLYVNSMPGYSAINVTPEQKLVSHSDLSNRYSLRDAKQYFKILK